MMWHELLVALALLMVIEGILPFLNPRGMRRMMQMAIELDDRSLRISGLVVMVLGVVLLYLVN
ncbi:MAG: DUF2065 domain-containing protein [Gammaproteobacteria bacterium]|nr:DUF2065 domain-containing protein [Gammaproteobacteria bacterium]